MKVMMDLNTIGVDPDIWRILWDAADDQSYDIKQLLGSMSPHQIQSKAWLVKELTHAYNEEFPVLMEKDNLKIQLHGGWVGFPIVALLKSTPLDIAHVENIDLDKKSLHVFMRYMKAKGYSYSEKCKDVGVKGPTDNQIDLVINTSSEHMPDLPVYLKNFRKVRRYKRDCVFAIQSNNMFHIDDHINCVNSVEELIEKTELHKNGLLYSGELQMENGYKRFMVIGYAHDPRNF